MTDLQWVERYEAHLRQYTAEQLRHKIKQEIWSLGQMYSHMILTALDYLDQAEACASEGAEQLLGKTDGGRDLFSRGGFPPIRIKLPEPENTPSNTESKEELLEGLELVRQRMQEWTGRSEQVNPLLKIKHDGFGWLTASEWYELINMHFAHHLRQHEELTDNLKLPGIE